MRLVQRSYSNPIPERLRAEAEAVLKDYYALSMTAQRQQRARLDRQWRASRRYLIEPLMELFRGKCAYCESKIGPTADVEIDTFRPVSASGLDGSGSTEHYQWLRVEWENLYPACPACNRAKRGLFPVDGPRAEIGTPIERIVNSEKALLLDPCRDEPAAHLEFIKDGMVVPLSRKGEATIQVLNLNRPQLVAARQETWSEVLHRMQIGEMKRDWISKDAAYTAVIEAAQKAAILSGNPTITLGPAQFRSAATPADEVLATSKEAFRLTQRPIRSIEVRNFKLLRDVNIELPAPSDERAPWLVLLGENASGKSSLLQAIALALAGAEEASKLTRASRVLSRGQSHGRIVIHFWDNDIPVRLDFERGRREFSGTQRPSATVRAFGALRHMERRSRENVDADVPLANIEQIMRPISRIEYPNRWLISRSPEQFDVIARALKDLLPIPVETLLVMSGSNLMIRLGDTSTPLSLVSAGYQTVIGVAVEIMKMVFEFWTTLDSASAIVIVDELDAHLHPRWKMRIVTALRTAFPNIQFIASTHDPLLLRGLRNHETALITRVDGVGAVVNTQLPPIEGMQVDEILTSSVFGLDSTIDPETEALFDEYYYLISHPQTDADRARIAELRERLADRESLGRNARENLMLEAAQKFLKETEDRPPVDMNRLRAETVQTLRDMFADVSLPPRRS